MTATTTSISRVAHLARRAGFGLPPAEVQRLSRLSPAALTSHFVDYDATPDTSGVPEPTFSNQPDDSQDLANLEHWWVARMLASTRQLEEKMTLFWHGLFATSNEKVGVPSLMYQQNQLFRTHALGDFQELVIGVCIDPAMLIWLDGNGSTKGAPNENFAREVMELFTLGVGHYTQDDVVAGARAFTGWYLDDNNRVQFSPDDHDEDPKTFLGQTGNFGYQEIARILTNHPACGRFLARKLWTFFAYPNPEGHIVSELAGVYRKSGRSIREVVRHLFLMPEFYGTKAGYPPGAGRVKTPIEYTVTAAREFGAKVNPDDIANYCYLMGQYPFYPPNVGGWPVGTRWMNTATVTWRFNFAEFLLEQHPNPADNHLDLAALLHRYRARTWTGVLQNIARYHLSTKISPLTWQTLVRFAMGHGLTNRNAPKTLESLLQLVMVAPEYHCA